MREIHRVLIVDDEPMVLSSLSRALTRGGYQVDTASSKGDALELLDRFRFDLVVTDVALPDGSGTAIAQRASELRPAPLVIAITGCASRTETYELGALGVRKLLEKPFSIEDLAAAIQEVAAGPAPPLGAHVVSRVGQEPVQSVVDRVRTDMFEQAMAIAGGNHNRAAKLLGVTRQAVQYHERTREDS